MVYNICTVYEKTKHHSKGRSKDYSATLGIGSIVLCQIEAYFLALNKVVDEGCTVLDVR
jgi:hypothetical protein